MLFIAPMAPALQPPNSMRCPAVAPSLWLAISEVIVAGTTCDPRNAKLYVLAEAAASPLHRSEVQYLGFGVSEIAA